MTGMRCGEVFLANYRYTDDSSSKVRPVLVVSADDYNRGDDVVVVPISSAPNSRDRFTFPIDSASAPFEATGLRQTSSVKWTKPHTISRRVIRRRLGHLPSGPLSEIQSRIQGLFQS